MNAPVQLTAGRSPWERLPHEGVKAFDAFKLYGEKGTGRTLRTVAAELRKSVGLIGRWASKYHWQFRVQAFDDWRQAQVIEGERKELVAQGKEWAKRFRSVREDEWALAQQLLERGKQMVKWPLTQQSVREERYTLDELREAVAAQRFLVKSVTELHPSRWTVDTARGIIELASKLMRLATGAPTEVTDMNVTGGVQVEHTGAVDLQEQETLERAKALLFERMCHERGLDPGAPGRG